MVNAVQKENIGNLKMSLNEKYCITCKWSVLNLALHQDITYDNSDDLDIRCSNPQVSPPNIATKTHPVTGIEAINKVELRLCSVERADGLTLFRPCGPEGKLWEAKND